MTSQNHCNPDPTHHISTRTRVEYGNITSYPSDAIVNAANETLLGGGGVDGAIHRVAGPKLREFCATLGGCEVGEAKASPGFLLPCQHIIHTVGPVWAGGTQDEVALLGRCYQNSLSLAVSLELKTVVFPAISCGAFGFPIVLAAETAMTAVASFLATDETLEMVTFLCLGDEVYEALGRARQARV